MVKFNDNTVCLPPQNYPISIFELVFSLEWKHALLQKLISFKWYHVTANISSTLALYGPGSLFFSTKDPMDLGQQWQIFLNNEIYYVLRNNQLGPTEVISTFGNSEGGAPAMSSIPEADLSMYWAIIPWGDWTYYITNPANGSNWHLNVVADNTTNLLIDISSNITAPQVSVTLVVGSSLGSMISIPPIHSSCI